ncbi:DUF748 domain-containing protein [Candidatus Nitrospira neomarina]|uniref:DUF748 domain-containing protein n=1 Tax=Candidatus Nitrospira neomarina TaxID=3020899 RepID=A0AA96GR17_9BACT|nr:DUF748 domain-containing protein [Candidatus Nitrospira neomarina]WNM62554.1 DUF748 domain-containing protein [Candidatus Nitrospira neomarina]
MGSQKIRPWWMRALILTSGIMGFILLLLVVTSFFIDESLRAYIETNLNTQLKGYTVELETVDFHPLGFSIDFENLTLRQETNPEPPLLIIPFWSASIQWTQLFKMEIVSDHLIKNAKVVFAYPQAEKEVKDITDVKDKGWQEALYALYPVTINTFRVEDSSLSYRDQSDHPPLELTNLQLNIENIQNIRSKKGEYPTTVHLEGSLPQAGLVSISGKGNFLAEPFPGIAVDFDMKNVQLQSFLPVSTLVNVEIHSGTLNGHGHIEYSPWANMAQIVRLEIENPYIHYVEKDSPTKAQKAKRESSTPDTDDSKKSQDPFKVAIDSASVKNGEFGYKNQTTTPPYTIFVNHVDIQVTGVGVPKVTQKGELELFGKFMGKGKTSIKGGFRPEVKHPDFDIKVKIDKTDMTTLNDAFKAFAGFDVKSGEFSLISELHTDGGRVQGYIKPFFDKPEIYDLSQDKTDNIFQQLYEGVVSAVASLLENVPRDQVATKTDITGNLDNIKIGTWELIWNLFRNAFVDAMTPAFENLKTLGKKN